MPTVKIIDGTKVDKSAFKMKKIPRIKKITDVSGLCLTCIFTNGEVRQLDFEKIFADWKVSAQDVEYLLLKEEEFQQVKIRDGVLSWDNVKIKIQDEFGKETEVSYELDPLVMYELSVLERMVVEI